MGDRDEAPPEHILDKWQSETTKWDYEPPELITPWLEDVRADDFEWEGDDGASNEG